MSALQTTRPTGTQLSLRQRSRRIELERVISAGIETINRTYVQVGNALAEIRDGKLYLDTHTSFEAYLKDEWQLDKGYAYRQIKAAKLAEQLADCPVQPDNAWVVQPMSVLGSPEENKEIWNEATETAGGHPSAAQVKEVVEKRKPVAARIGPPDTDPIQAAKDSGIVPLAAEVTVIQPDPATEPKPEPVAAKELTEDEWLETLPARERLAKGLIRDRFDAAALCYRRSEPAKEAYRNATRAFRKEAKRESSGKVPGYVSIAEWFLRLADPAHWLVCEGCGGTGRNDVFNGDCPTCQAEGYHVK